MTRRWRLVLLPLAASACVRTGAGTTPSPRTASSSAPRTPTAPVVRAAPDADPRTARAAFRLAIDSVADGPDFRSANWGILIVDPRSGDTLYSRNAAKLFMPASNMKIVTSATAWTQLGPDYRYRTTLAARGPVRDGTLSGDLLVIGRGDPTVSSHMRGDAMLPLRELADSLAAHGVHRVAGRLVAAGDAFAGSVLGYGWSFDELDASYAAGVDELLFNEGFSVLHVTAGARPGDPVRVQTAPARTFPRVRVLATTAAPLPEPERPDAAGTGPRRRTLDATTDSLSRDFAAVVTGWLAPGDSATLELAHRDPDAAYLAALGEALRDRGIRVDGRPADTTAAVDTLFTTFSPPLREILPALLKPSQNQIAEVLLRTLALERTGVGTADSGRKVVERQLAAWGVPPDGAIIRDGSGLSRYDYLAPETIVRVLDILRRSPDFRAYYDALPVAGVDGTIGHRMRGTPAAGNVHAKTGTVSQARSLSGFVTTADQRMLVFSFLCNNFTVPARSVDRVVDGILVRLASSPRP